MSIFQQHTFRHTDDGPEAGRNVYASWLEAANNEKLTRGPCIIIKPYNKFYSFKRSLENLRIKSSICFCFLDRRLYYKKGARITPTLQTGGYETMYYDCTFIVADKEMSRHPISNIACMFLPQIPNVGIKSFQLKSLYWETIAYREMMNTIVKSMPSHEISTCFLIFCDYLVYREAFWQLAIQKSIRNAIFICSTVSGITFIHRYAWNSWRQLFIGPFGILITGSIQTWSTILKEDCITEERIEAKLKLFKDEVKLKKHSIGFMFICTARRYLYNATNVEPMIFKRLFPKVPFIGFSVQSNQFKKSIIVSEEKNIKKEYESERSYHSTLFLIVTYG